MPTLDFLPRSAVAGEESPRADYPRIEGYKIIDRIGVGGMAAVWKARQLAARRIVALKVLNVASVSDVARRRFEREIEIATQIEHPNIARVYDSGAHGGYAYFAMELIDGQPLDAAFAKRGATHRDILQTFSTICKTIQYAHQLGVLHRDLKPSNILLDVAGQPHIVDFGLGKLLTVEGVDPKITVSGEWAGTPLYMSPEQARASNAIDSRSDIYSLGVILYQLLIGQHPRNTEGSYLTLVQRIVEEEVIRPRKLNARIDGDLEALLLKSLAHEAKDRYASADAFANDIDNYLKGEPVTAHSPTVIYFLRKKIRKHRAKASLVALALFAAIGASVHGSIQVANERDAALYQAKTERNLRQLAEARFAAGEIDWADEEGAGGHWTDAKAHYADAYRILSAWSADTTNARLGLLDAIEHTPHPIASASPTTGSFELFAAPDGRGVEVPCKDGQVRSIASCDGKIIGAFKSTVPAGRTPFVCVGDNQPNVYSIKIDNTPQGDSTTLDGASGSGVSIDGLLVQHPVCSGDGRYAALVMRDSRHLGLARILLLDGRKGQIVGSTGLLPQPSIAFDGGSTRLAACDSEGNLRSLVTPRLDIEKSFKLQLPATSEGTANVEAVALPPAGNAAIVADAFGRVFYINLVPAQIPIQLAALNAHVRCLAISADGQWCACATGSEIALFSLQNGRIARSLEMNGHIFDLRFSPKSDWLCGEDVRGNLAFWSLPTPQNHLLVSYPSPIVNGATSHDSTLLAAGLENKDIIVTDLHTGESRWSATTESPIRGLSFVSDGAVRCSLQNGQIIDYGQGGQVRVRACVAAGFRPYDRDPLSQRWALCFNGDATLIDITNSKILPLGWRNDGNGIGVISSDQRWAVAYSGTVPSHITCVDTMSGKAGSLEAYDHVLSVIAISPDDKLLFWGCPDGSIFCQDRLSGNLVWSSRGVASKIVAVACSANGGTLLSGNAQGDLQLWDVGSGRLLRAIAHLPNPVTSVSFTDNDNGICSTDGRCVRYWDINATTFDGMIRSGLDDHRSRSDHVQAQ
jgi:WD40 repeat protein